jgi:DinB superfamily
MSSAGGEPDPTFPSGEKLPPLAAEDYACNVCALVYPEIAIDRAVEIIGGLPAAVRAAVGAINAEALRARPGPHIWSVVEYVCHLRDVYVSFTVRLYRTRTEDRPTLEPMFNDLRARRFRYNDCDLAATLDELEAASTGFCSEIACNSEPDWDRVATRLPTEQRSARWLVRQAMHEGVHHLGDIRRIGAAFPESITLRQVHPTP